MEVFTGHFEAIGVLNQVTVAQESAAQGAITIARREVQALDQACSRFREDSELAVLNREGQGAASPLLMAAVRAALDAAESTGGLVDPTVGSALKALGYDRDFEIIVRRGASPAFEISPVVGWRAVRVDEASATVSLPRGSELDLGATAKAFAADRIAAAVHTITGSPVLISLGGDIAVAGSAPPRGWPILVTDDSRESQAAGQVVSVRAGGLATSSTTVRRWRAGEVQMHHIVDPRTGAPADTCWRTVSVAASTCLEANCASTAAIVLGAKALPWLQRRNLSARLVRTDGTIQTTGGWPDQANPTDDAATHRSDAEAIYDA